MKSVTLFLNDDKITPDEFRDWVDRVTRKMRGMYPTPDGPWATQGGAWFEYPNKIPIRGYHITIDQAGKDLYDEIEIGNLEVNRYGKRLKVIFNYSDLPELVPYFVKFFNEFTIDWPDSTNILEQEFQNILKKYGLIELLPNDQVDQNNGNISPDLSTSGALSDIDQLCLKWVNRTWLENDNMEEFLRKNEAYISKDVFKRALKDASTRGVIEKVGGRWRLPKNIKK